MSSKNSNRNGRSLAQNTIFNLLKTLSSVIFPLITFPYISRVLQPEHVGKYNFAYTYVSYFALIASLGITAYAVRTCSEVREDKEKLNRVSSQIFSINICSTVIAYIIFFLSLCVFRVLDPYRDITIILSSTILFASLGADWINSVFEDFKYITIKTVLFQCVSLVALFIFVRKPSDYLKYATISAVSSVGANILNIFYRKKYCKITFVPKLKMMNWKVHFPPIVLLFTMICVQTVFSSTDITILGIMRSDHEIGLYSIAVKIYNICNELMASILWVMLPRLSSYYGDRQYTKINLLLKKCVQFMLGIGLPIIVGCIAIADEIIYIIGGDAYAGAEVYLRLLMIALFFSLIGGAIIGNMIMLPSKREKYFLRACCVAAFVNIILNLLFVKKFGAYAAAISTIIAHAIIFAMLYPKIEKEIDVSSFKEFLFAPSMGCLVIVLICKGIKLFGLDIWLYSVLSISCSGIAYVLILYCLKYELLVDGVVRKINDMLKRNRNYR